MRALEDVEVAARGRAGRYSTQRRGRERLRTVRAARAAYSLQLCGECVIVVWQ